METRRFVSVKPPVSCSLPSHWAHTPHGTCPGRAAEHPSERVYVGPWNASHPIGTPVRYWSGFREGDGIESRTRSAAQLLAGTPVVWVEGHGACIALTHVEVV